MGERLRIVPEGISRGETRHARETAPAGAIELEVAKIHEPTRRTQVDAAFAPQAVGIVVQLATNQIRRLGRASEIRRVFVVGDAERMVPQEGADMAANAFLKLLEEPLPDTFLILTTSEPGAGKRCAP